MKYFCLIITVAAVIFSVPVNGMDSKPSKRKCENTEQPSTQTKRVSKPQIEFTSGQPGPSLAGVLQKYPLFKENLVYYLTFGNRPEKPNETDYQRITHATRDVLSLLSTCKAYRSLNMPDQQKQLIETIAAHNDSEPEPESLEYKLIPCPLVQWQDTRVPNKNYNSKVIDYVGKRLYTACLFNCDALKKRMQNLHIDPLYNYELFYNVLHHTVDNNQAKKFCSVIDCFELFKQRTRMQACSPNGTLESIILKAIAGDNKEIREKMVEFTKNTYSEICLFTVGSKIIDDVSEGESEFTDTHSKYIKCVSPYVTTNQLFTFLCDAACTGNIPCTQLLLEDAILSVDKKMEAMNEVNRILRGSFWPPLTPEKRKKLIAIKKLFEEYQSNLKKT